MTPLNSIDLDALWPQNEADRNLLTELKLWQLRDHAADIQLSDSTFTQLELMPRRGTE